jgi:alkaline phosphatase D
VTKPSGPSLDRFDPPAVVDAPVTAFDDDGLGTEPNNLKAINSLRGYRTLRYGKNVELIITDQHSYRSEDPTNADEAGAFNPDGFPNLYPEDVLQIIDGGRAYDGGKPPATIRFDGKDIPNYRKDAPPQTVLGAEQRAWFKDRLRTSRATWKVWGSTLGTLDWRADPQNLPQGLTKPWPGQGYAGFGASDLSGAYIERAEIYDLVRDEKVTGFATLAGDRHSFWAGYSAKALPPKPYEPVGVAFVTGSISAPGMVESMEHRFPKDHPLRPLFMADRPGQPVPEPAVNLLIHRGVKACLEYQRTGDIKAARAATNPDLSPHLEFIDMAGHGYGVVSASPDAFETEFVCIERPIERASGEDGGPLRYRVVHRAKLWQAGERPVLEQTVVEGDPKLSV